MNHPTFELRSPCARCGATDGRLERKATQDTVRCRNGHWCYNAPRSETGLPTISKRTRPDITPARRRRIIDSCGNACVSCHRADLPLEVGHLISVKEGREAGATDCELFSDENLAAMCDACNSGASYTTVSLRLMVQVLRIRTRKAESDAETA